MQTQSLNATGAILDRVDLQLHSLRSDGAWSAEVLGSALVAAGIGYAALTEHDWLTPQDELEALERRAGCRMVPGVEVTCFAAGRYVDLLCYGASAQAPALDALNGQLWERQLANTRQVREAIPVLRTLSDLEALTTAQMPHRLRDGLGSEFGGSGEKLRVLKAHGYRLQAHGLADVVAACRADGWVCLIAHPGAEKTGHPALSVSEVLELTSGYRIDGLEVFSPAHGLTQEQKFADFCEAQGLLVAAGSDSHGAADGLGHWRAETCAALLRRVGRL